ncbi:tRNA lysidine(34) synthetase TilS [Candidatus Vidania fulgoroideorum]
MKKFFDKFIKKNKKIAVSYSGGLDSNLLLEICEKYYNNILLIHINHNNKNSNKIAKECLRISKIKNKEIIISKIKIKKKKIKKIGLECYYRKKRYKKIFKLMKKNKIKYLLVGHTLDDLVETFFINLSRGTGIKGVCSLKFKRKKGKFIIIRPMLYYSRINIAKQFLKKKLLISFDKSNNNIKIKRNFLRKYLFNKFYLLNNFCLKILIYIKNCREALECLKIIAKKDIKKSKMLINKIKKYKDYRIKNILKYFFEKNKFKVPSVNWFKELLKQIKSKKKDFIFNLNKNYIFEKKNKIVFKKMKIIVSKYGGASLNSREKIKKIALNIKKKTKKGYKIIVIVSAIGKETDNLCEEYKKISKKINKFYELYISTGEIKSCSIFCQIIKNIKLKTNYLTCWQIPINVKKINNSYVIYSINAKKIISYLYNNDVIIIPGFQGINNKKEIKTIGRGGSDSTAVEICKYLCIKKCYFYKDIDGIYNADPSLFKNCKLIKIINYIEILEISSLGSKILQLNCVVSIIRNNIIAYLINSNKKFLNMKKEKKSGTLIYNDNIKKIFNQNRIFVNLNKCFLNCLKIKKKEKINKIIILLINNNINIDNIIINKKKYYYFSFTSKTNINNLKIKNLKFKKMIKLTFTGLAINNYNNNFLKIFNLLNKLKIKVNCVSNSEICLKYVFEIKYLKKIKKIVNKIIKREI